MKLKAQQAHKKNQTTKQQSPVLAINIYTSHSGLPDHWCWMWNSRILNKLKQELSGLLNGQNTLGQLHFIKLRLDSFDVYWLSRMRSVPPQKTPLIFWLSVDISPVHRCLFCIQTQNHFHSSSGSCQNQNLHLYDLTRLFILKNLTNLFVTPSGLNSNFSLL